MYANLPIDDIQDGRLSWNDPAVQSHIMEISNAPWYEDEDRNLYIVLDDEVIGPDDVMTDTITALIHKRGDTEQALDIHSIDRYLGGLTYVNGVLRRFSTADGFYHA